MIQKQIFIDRYFDNDSEEDQFGSEYYKTKENKKYQYLEHFPLQNKIRKYKYLFSDLHDFDYENGKNIKMDFLNFRNLKKSHKFSTVSQERDSRLY